MTDDEIEQHKHDCLVRYIAAMPDREARKEFLAGMRTHPGGAAAVERIKASLKQLHKDDHGDDELDTADGDVKPDRGEH